MRKSRGNWAREGILHTSSVPAWSGERECDTHLLYLHDAMARAAFTVGSSSPAHRRCVLACDVCLQITPMRHHAAGTMLAAGLAVERGWAINMGGGMHHAFSSDGMGWCPFDDIMLAVRRLRKVSKGSIKKVRVCVGTNVVGCVSCVVWYWW